MKTALAALIVGYGLDLLLGDPSFFVSSDPCDRKSHCPAGKMAAEGISENAKGRSLPEEFFS